MAIYIDWPNAIIHVPKVDLTLIQSTPTEIRELNLNVFRLALKDLEDSADGMGFTKTHNHNTEVSLGGLTFARVIEILDPYTITFEDGQYAVNLVGANSNVADKVNVNQVSVRSQNSAGMISSPEIQFNTFDGVVTLDVDNGFSGTVYPTGTPLKPVNNIADAKTIAEVRGINHIQLKSDLTITTGTSIEGLTIESDDWRNVVIQSGVNSRDTVFIRLDLDGEVSGIWNVFIDCWLNHVTNFTGWMRKGSFTLIELAPYVPVIPPSDYALGQSFFDDIVPMYPSVVSTIVMNTDTSVAFASYSGLLEIKSSTVNSELGVGLLAGEVFVDVSCTGGDIVVGGIGKVTNNSTLTIDQTMLVNPELVTDSVWDEIASEHTSVGSTGKALTDAGGAGNPWASDTTINNDPGTFGELVQKDIKQKLIPMPGLILGA